MLNRITVIGYVGRDPEKRFSGDGKAVVNFSMAATEKWKSGDERKEHTEWFNVVCFAGLAEIVDQYVTKGRQVYVEGKLRTEEWVGKDGNKHKAVKILADRVVFFGGGPVAGPKVKGQETHADEFDGDDSDVPF
jgi:single-strand DNA-binding protein